MDPGVERASRTSWGPAWLEQMRANDVGWPAFNRRFVNCPQFQKDWCAYRQTYHSMAENDLMAKTLREKCINEEVRKTFGKIKDLNKVWDTLDTWSEGTSGEDRTARGQDPSTRGACNGS